MVYRQCACRQHCVGSSNYYGECSCVKCQADRQRNGGRRSELCNFIVIINSFPVLNLCNKESHHEQNVNFSENHAQNLKISGCIVEGIFIVSVAAFYISLPIKKAIVKYRQNNLCYAQISCRILSEVFSGDT